MSRRARFDDDEGGVDLTPMLDIVFIMLIFFIVTATFIQEQGLDLSRPNENEDPPTVVTTPIVIRITADNHLFIQDERGELRRIDIRQVRANVERELASDPQRPVLIQAEREADVGVTIKAMDEVRKIKDVSGGRKAVSVAAIEV